MFATWFTLVSCLAYSSTLNMERPVPPKRRLTSNALHGVISQKIELFITIAVRTSNLVIRCSHTILTSKFTLNSNNEFKFGISQHGLCFSLYTLYWWCRTRNQSGCPLTIVRMPAPISVSGTEFAITLQVAISSYMFPLPSCRCFRSRHSV
jgi:hypothetical protein